MLIVRAWTDVGSPSEFRARITATLDLEDPAPEVTVAACRDDVLALLDTWLARFVDGGGHGPGR